MTPNLHPFCCTLLCLITTTFAASGCATLELPNSPFSKQSREYQGVDSGYDGGQSAVSQQIYHAVRQAKAENGVVLQVIGDDTPCRVLPLPPGAKTVYVSEMMTQTGVIQKLEHINATLFRYSTDAIGGIPMEVKMDKEGRHVRPESDYALQAGDRLMVSKAPHPAMQSLVNALLGLN